MVPLGRCLSTPVPMITKKTLKNGLTLVTESMPHVRSVAIGVWLKRGSRHERAAMCGISHFLEHMVFKGTRNRSAQRIAEEMDSIGGHMDAFTTKEYAAFHLKVLDEHLPVAMDLLADIVKNPVFDPLEMDKEKKVILEEIHMVEDTPDDLVMELFVESFWPDHALGRPILGTRRSLAGIERRHLSSYFRSAYHAGNIVIAAAGNLDHRDTARLVRRHFADLPLRAAGRQGPPPKPVARIVTRRKRELEQVHVCLGAPALPLGHEDRYVAFLLNTILGGSMSSRLFQTIRERLGLVYSISSGLSAYSDAGFLAVYAGTSLPHLDQLLAATVDQLRRFREEVVPESELRRAKDQLKGSLMLSLENTGSRMSHIARQEIHFGRQQPLDRITAGIEAVESRDILRLAQQIFQGQLSLSVLGNIKDYRPRRSLLRLD